MHPTPPVERASAPEPQSVGTLKRFLRAERESTPIFFWSFLVGTLAGLVGGTFRALLAAVDAWRRHLPALGLIIFSAVTVYLAILLVRRFAPEAAGSGIQEIEGTLDEARPMRWRRLLPVKFLSGLLALGGGMVQGREGPTIQMGGSLGKMIGEWFRASDDDVHTLIAAGAGAGLAAAFNAPFAGVLFVIEEMRPEFKYNFLSVHSVVIACAMSDIVVRMLAGQGNALVMPILPMPPLDSLWLFLVFGAVFGVLGVIFNKVLVQALDAFAGLPGGAYTLTGLYVGAFIGFLGWLSPNVIGSGDDVIAHAVQAVFPATTLILLFASRFGTTVLSYGSGSPGGIFAPMLALGTLFGMWFGHFTHDWLPAQVNDPVLFATAGMAALFIATVRAPLTGIALTVEMTGNYAQILPLMLTGVGATVVAQGLGGKPIYTVLLQRTLQRAGPAEAADHTPDAAPT